MIILPAIDLKGGKCVRLRQGKAEDCKVYCEDPVEMALDWKKQGAKYLHIVDLDGAFEGKPAHSEVIGKIIKAIGIPVEVGGGLRTDADIQALIDIGVDRAILGTRALTDRQELARLIKKFGSKLAVGIDAKGGKVQVRGWVETTDIDAVKFASEISQAGVKTIIFTDTSRDGMLRGVNLQAMDEMCKAVKCNVIASGGISSLADVQALKKLQRKNLVGAIVGKALYEGTVTLKELQAV